jgi:hypothetical protein
MQKAGLIEEMTSEALDSALGGDDLEEEADEAVDAVLREVAGDLLDTLPAAKTQPVRECVFVCSGVCVCVCVCVHVCADWGAHVCVVCAWGRGEMERQASRASLCTPGDVCGF